MSLSIDLILYNAGQLVTCASPKGAKRGEAMRDVGVILKGAVAIKDGLILAAGETVDILAQYSAPIMLDLEGKAVVPGFVDAHTHLVFAGNRLDEFEMRLGGATYMEIMNAGGGIANTVRATRATSLEQLVEQSRSKADTLLASGSTTVEVKTGYGLDTPSELKLLDAIEALNNSHPIDFVPTFLGAHAIPVEYQKNAEGYVRLVISEMLPLAADWYAGSTFSKSEVPFFCDVFCEKGVFDLEQSRRVLEAGLEYGLKTKIHADEFENLGGVALAIELGAVSVDHLDTTPKEEIMQLAGSDTVGVVLPAVNFNLGSKKFAPARELIDSGVALALATDFNPGSAPCPSIPMVMAISCRYQGLLPAEVLNACTINAAHALGLGDRTGSLEPGKQADLLILETDDYRNLAFQFGSNLIGQIVKRGRLIER
jgi:imidazolonepropionase